MATITNSKQLSDWLKRKPVFFAAGIAVRTALRVLPLATRGIRYEGNDLTAAVFRALFISWASRAYHAQETNSVANVANAANAATAYVANAAYAAAAAARSAYAAGADIAAYATDTATDTATYADAAAYADAATDVATDAARAAEIWEAISKDTAWLTRKRQIAADAIAGLVQAPLWLEGIPGEWAERWRRLRVHLEIAAENWDVWIDWYERRLAGEASGFGLSSDLDEQFAVRLATEDEAFWDRKPAVVNADIKARLEQLRPEPPQIPAAQPASVKPRWIKGKLAQDDRLETAVERESLHALLEALSEDYEELCGDLEDSANVDRRAIQMLRRTAAQMKPAELGRSQIFRLANRLTELQGYGHIVLGEWSEEDGVRYSALALQFGNLLNSYPEIREFIDALPKMARSEAEVEALIAVDEDLIATLQGEDAQPVVDDTLPDAMREALDDLVDDLRRRREERFDPSQDATSFENVLRGINATLGELFGEMASRATTSLKSEALHYADDLGPNLTKLLKKLWKLKTAASTAAVTTAATQPVVANWEVLAQISPNFALLMGMLAFLVTAQLGKSKD